MSTIDRLLDPIPIPRLVKVRQSFERPQVADVAGELVRQLLAAGAFIWAAVQMWRLHGTLGPARLPAAATPVEELPVALASEPATRG